MIRADQIVCPLSAFSRNKLKVIQRFLQNLRPNLFYGLVSIYHHNPLARVKLPRQPQIIFPNPLLNLRFLSGNQKGQPAIHLARILFGLDPLDSLSPDADSIDNDKVSQK